MNKKRASISTDRLFQASEAVIQGATQVARATGKPSPYPTDLIGTPIQPECLRGFLLEEIQEACDFLTRLGVLYRTGTRPAA